MKRKSELILPQRPGGSGGARALGPSRLTVLHIDDDPNDTELLQAASRRAGVPFVMQHIHDGEQAIAYLSGSGVYGDRRRYPLPELILLDLKLAGTSGFEVLKWVRSHSQLRTMPIVVLSGSERQEHIQLAYSMGANSYIVKPPGFQQLVRVAEALHTVWFVRPLRGPIYVSAMSNGSIPPQVLDIDCL
jgi:DNA-binding response OmpR family regulator